MSQTLKKKSASLEKIFSHLPKQKRYEKLIEMGKQLPPLEESFKTPDRKVAGCQSTLYLACKKRKKLLHFHAHADSLITAGLAALLIHLYSGESARVILTCPPEILCKLEIASSLSLNRSSGFAFIYLRMKQLALEAYTKKKI